MSTVTYTSSQLLACAACSGDVVLCVKDGLTASGFHFVNASILAYQESWSSCGVLGYIYDLSYTTSQLADPNVDLLTTDITGIFCKGCLTTYIEAMPQITATMDFPGGLDKSVLFIHPNGVVDQDVNHFSYDIVNQIFTIKADTVFSKLNSGVLISNGSVAVPTLHADLAQFASPSGNYLPLLTCYGDANSQVQQFIVQPGNSDVNALTLIFKGRAGDGSAGTPLQNGDSVYRMLSLGADGTAYHECACVAFEVDDQFSSPSAVAPGNLPGKMIFEISNGNGYWAAYERWWINSHGEFCAAPNQGPGINGGQSIVHGNTCEVFHLTATNEAIFGIPALYCVGQTASREQIVLIGTETNTIGGTMSFAKTRASSTGYNTAAEPSVIVADDDILGRIAAFGADGSDYQAAARIQFEVDGAPGVGDMPGRIVFQTTLLGGPTIPRARWSVNALGNLFSDITYGGSIVFQAEALNADATALLGKPALYALINGNVTEAICAVGVSNNAIGGTVHLLHTRSASDDANTIVQNSDILGRISFSGADGASYQSAARIQGEVDGIPGAGSMPGRLTFLTTPTATVIPRQRWAINAVGDWYGDGTYGGNVIFNAAGKGLQSVVGVGPIWSDFGGYTAAPPVCSGYITLKVGGATYKVLVTA